MVICCLLVLSLSFHTPDEQIKRVPCTIIELEAIASDFLNVHSNLILHRPVGAQVRQAACVCVCVRALVMRLTLNEWAHSSSFTRLPFMVEQHVCMGESEKNAKIKKQKGICRFVWTMSADCFSIEEK